MAKYISVIITVMVIFRFEIIIGLKKMNPLSQSPKEMKNSLRSCWFNRAGTQ